MLSTVQKTSPLYLTLPIYKGIIGLLLNIKNVHHDKKEHYCDMNEKSGVRSEEVVKAMSGWGGRVGKHW